MIRKKVQVHLWRTTPTGERLYAIFHRCAAKGDYWQPITGNVDKGETPEACALREAFEEAGVKLPPSELTPCVWIHDWSRGEKQFEERVFGLKCQDTKITISSEHRAYEWASYAEAIQCLQFEGNRRGMAWVESYLSDSQRRRHA